MTKGRWIWLNADAKKDEYVDFFDEFDFSAGKTARLKISVGGDYAFYVNGKLAAFDQYADYAYRKVYDDVDITEFCSVGKNEIKITAWYIGHSSSNYRDFGAGLLYEIEVGGKLAAYSRKGQRCRYAEGYVNHVEKTISDQLGLTYTYDFGDKKTGFVSATEVGGFGYDLIKRENEKLVIKPTSEGKLVDKEKKIYDVGRERSGFLHIKFRAAKGEKITVAYGEHLIDGKVRRLIHNRDFSVNFIGSGKTEEFLGVFRRLGCRYLQVEGNAEVEYIGIAETEYPFKEIPYDIKDERRKKIYETAVRTLVLCHHEHYEDCPWREQSMYIMDTRNQIRFGYYAFENSEQVRAAINSMVAGHREDGLFDLCFPSKIGITIPSFALAFTSIVREYLVYSGDVKYVSSLIPVLEKTVGFFRSRYDGRGITENSDKDDVWNFYEWTGNLDGNLGGFKTYEGMEKKDFKFDSLINAFLAISYGDIEYVCRAAGFIEKADFYAAERKKLCAAIKKTFYNAENGLFRSFVGKETYSALANALCVLAGAVEGKQAEDICDKLAFGYDGWYKNTISMDVFRYDALIMTNQDKYENAILSDIDKTFGYMIDQGATSFWETILGAADFDNAGSLCHGWSASPVYYYRIFGVCGKREKKIKE